MALENSPNDQEVAAALRYLTEELRWVCMKKRAFHIFTTTVASIYCGVGVGRSHGGRPEASTRPDSASRLISA